MEACILVVDDDALFQEAASIVLRSAGHEVHAAGSLHDADRLLASRRIDLVLLDVHIPGNEGLEWLRARARHDDAPAMVLCTGFPGLDTAIDAVALPVFGYLVKPIADDRLIGEVRRVLDESGARPVTPRDALQEKLDAARERYRLTRRQLEVLTLLAEGHANDDVAERLGCARRTVELHVTELLRKTGTRSRTALVARLFRAVDDGGK